MHKNNRDRGEKILMLISLSARPNTVSSKDKKNFALGKKTFNEKQKTKIMCSELPKSPDVLSH